MLMAESLEELQHILDFTLNGCDCWELGEMEHVRGGVCPEGHYDWRMMMIPYFNRVL